MKRTLRLSFIFATLTGLPMIGEAQDVRDLTGHEPTSQELIETLKPREGHRTRGVGMAAPAGRPQCQAYKAARSRGISPVSDAVAMKVVFAFNSAELSPQATKTLDELGKALTSNDLKSYCFVVEGHTDNIGSEAYNLKLSERRAQSVVRYLRDHFQIEEDRLQAMGLGKQKPIADNSTDEGRQKNRRVQIANLGS
jgi:outer membrane protein OmpA-like peptidoglycan-associated protein